MREYETTFIARADLSDEAVRQLADRTKAIIERYKGTILDFQILGRQNLAYQIAKQSKGNYVFFDYAAESAAVGEIERTLRLDEGILKFLTVKIREDVNVEARREEIRVRKEKLSAAMVAAAVAPAPSANDDSTEEITEVIEESSHA